MKKNIFCALIALFCLVLPMSAQQLGTQNLHIKVDQFGYLPNAQKMAVVSQPQNGYNAPDSFTPGATLEVKKWDDNVTVVSGSAIAWNGGATHGQSGDKVWWFDFSSLVNEGDYYIYDAANSARSVRFTVGDAAYADALKQTVRALFYQRCGIHKAEPFAEPKWADGTCHQGLEQDAFCQLVGSSSSSVFKNLSGGWHDAGDYNKYVPFVYSTVVNMLLAYEHNPSAFSDDYGIPESGNGIPDVLDEVKYELEWLRRMQQSNGSFLHKVSVTDFSAASPPSADTGPRRYGAASTLATASGAAVFALAAIQFNAAGQSAYADTLTSAASNGWTWLNSNPNVVFSNTGFSSVSAEADDYERLARRVGVAAFMYRRTGLTSYRTFVDNNYQQLHMMQWEYAYPFEQTHQDVLLYYASTAGATIAVKNSINSVFTHSMQTNNADNLPNFLNGSDAYRAYMADNNYTWGNNQYKAAQGSMFFSVEQLNLATNDSVNQRNAGMGFLHYLHGVNPTAYCYISNMGGHGAEFSVPEIYHGWFNDGTVFDNVNTSPYGPAPGFLPGGANPTYSPDGAYIGPAISPPQNQPIQKSYHPWNTDSPENSWEISEPAIYTQGAYIRLVAEAMKYRSCKPAVLTGSTSVCQSSQQTYSVLPGAPGTIYLWSVGGGTITSGQGTPSITVLWSSSGAGSVNVTVSQ